MSLYLQRFLNEKPSSMKKLILNITISLTMSGALLGDTAGDIAKKHATAQAVELEAYLKQNPEAQDKDEAISHLLNSYALTENKERFVTLLQQRFDSLGSGVQLEAQRFYSIAHTLFNMHLEAGNKESARKVIDTATQKIQGNQAAEQLTNAFSQMERQLNLPGKGDTMEIKFTSLDGKEVDLAAMKGKVILIDFWATWCGPCIAELPHVIATYEKYQDQGFEVIGISLDQETDREKLKTFIKDRNMTWPQYFDGKGWGNEIAQQYGISSIPATFLIGKDGTVAATNLRGDALDEAVSYQLSK